MAHQKHPPVKKPSLGRFSRNELAILGTSCSVIKEFSELIGKHMEAHFRMGYMDADHKAAENIDSGVEPYFSRKITDKIGYFQWEIQDHLHAADHLLMNDSLDLLLINGNHFEASSQIVFIDQAKESSLRKRLGQLSDVKLIILSDSTDVFGFLADHLGTSLKGIPVLGWDQMERILAWVESYLESLRPPVKGLVLAGGRSTRMGEDKGKLDYHGIPQRTYMYDLLNRSGLDTYISMAGRSQSEGLQEERLIFDEFPEMGPFGAILSAFKQDPNAAWLVVACDLPYLDALAIQNLLERRGSDRYATAYFNPETGFPDPLFTIYEPRIYIRMLQFLGMGYSCPRKVLINADIRLLELHDPNWLINVNTREELLKYFERKGIQG